jgi:hypothetical protein
MAQEKVTKNATLEQMAEAAQTPAEHVKVSKQYRLRAEGFDLKAKQHEDEARKLEKQPRSPIEHKWPAMAKQPWIKERERALEARRAANESREIADRHMRLSVEALAEGPHGSQPAASSGSDN